MPPPPTPNFLIGAKDTVSAVIKSAISTIRDTLNTTAEAAVKWTKGLSSVAEVMGPLVRIASLLFSMLQNVFVAAAAVFSIVSAALNIIRSLFSIVASIFSFIQSVVSAVLSIFKAVLSAIGTLVSTVSTSIAKVAGGSHSILGSLVKYALGIAAVVAGAFAAAALTAEDAWQPLAQTIGRIGILGGGAAAAGVRELAREIRRATTIASDGILTLAEKALRLRVPADQLQAVSAAAVGLAAALGITAGEAMDKLTSAIRGDFDGLKNWIPGLQGATSEAGKLAIVMGVARQGIDLAAAKASTFGGLWQSFKNVLSENAASLGEKIAPGVKLIVDALRPLLGLLESTGDTFANAFNAAADALAPFVTQAVAMFAELHARLFAFGKTVKDNWSLTWDFIWASLLYYTVAIVLAVKSFFTTILPAYFNWFKEFGSEWVSVLGEGLKVGFVNLFKNLGDMAYAGLQYIRLKMNQPEVADQWFASIPAAFSRSLTESFKNAKMPALPKFGKRVATPIETALENAMNEKGGLLNRIFGANFGNYLNGFNAIIGGKAKNDVKDKISGITGQPAGGKGSGESGGNTTLESRFLTRAPGGLTPTEQILSNSLQVQRDQLAEQRAKAAAERAASRALLALDRTIQFMANTMTVVE